MTIEITKLTIIELLLKVKVLCCPGPVQLQNLRQTRNCGGRKDRELENMKLEVTMILLTQM